MVARRRRHLQTFAGSRERLIVALRDSADLSEHGQKLRSRDFRPRSPLDGEALADLRDSLVHLASHSGGPAVHRHTPRERRGNVPLARERQHGLRVLKGFRYLAAKLVNVRAEERRERS